MTAGTDLPGRLACARRRWLIVGLAVGALALALASAATAATPFQVGLQDSAFDGTATPQTAAAGAQVMSAIGGSVVRINVFWAEVAPTTPAAQFDANNPADPEYQWSALDTTVRRAAADHLIPLLVLSSAPIWAQGPNRPPIGGGGLGAWDPNPAQFSQFAQAVAERYSGNYPDPLQSGSSLPRVTYYEIWNEPNLPVFLAGQDVVGVYRSLLTAAYNAIKAVQSSNQVVLGGLAPVSYDPPATIAPLKFAAELMCLRRIGRHFVRLGGRCQSPPFDILAEHPYSLGATPTETGSSYDDVLVADVHKLSDLLKAGQRLHTIRGGSHGVWVTEWGWVTRPPDFKYGDSFATAARYVAYSMYEMWKAGVSLVVWQGIHDNNASGLGGDGLETRSGRRKPTLQAFAFPFIASVSGRRGLGWGRVPAVRRVSVTVQRRTRRGWRRVATARTGSDGVFTVHFAASGNATYRAQGPGGTASLPYFSARIPARFTHR